MDKKISFEVENLNIVEELEDEQLAIVEVFVCHDGNNAHNMPISLSVLDKAKDTLKNKFLVAGFNGRDFEGHEPDEQIIGFFPESSKMSFVEKGGKNYLVAQAVMSKVYARWAYDLFVKDNERAVSMEITVFDWSESEDGTTHIEGFVFNGVTILGHDHLPACEGSNAQIIKFSTESASEIYSSRMNRSNSIKKQFVNDMTPIGFSGKEDSNNMNKEEEKKVVEEKDDTTYMAEENNEEVKSEESKSEEQEEVKEKENFESSSETENEESKEEEPSEEDYSEDKSENEDDTSDEEAKEDNNFESDSEEKEDSDKDEKSEEKDEEMESLRNENCELKEKNSALEEKIKKYEAAEKAQAVEKILSEVVDLFSADEITSLREEANNLELSELSGFENKVKAQAFEAVKTTKKEQKSFTKIAITSTMEEVTSSPKGLW